MANKSPRDEVARVQREARQRAIQEIGDAMKEAKKFVPKRPHPRSRDTPPANVIVGAAAGVTDRVIDLTKEAVPLPEERVLLWGADLCDVLSYLHGKGVVFRDMKPDNVMLDRHGQMSPRTADAIPPIPSIEANPMVSFFLQGIWLHYR